MWSKAAPKRSRLPSRGQVLELGVARSAPAAPPAAAPPLASPVAGEPFRGSAAFLVLDDPERGFETLRPCWPGANSAWRSCAGAPRRFEDAPSIARCSGPRRQRRSKREANPGPVPAKGAAAVPRDGSPWGWRFFLLPLLNSCHFSVSAIRPRNKVKFPDRGSRLRSQSASAPPTTDRPLRHRPVQRRSWLGSRCDPGGRCDRSGLAKAAGDIQSPGFSRASRRSGGGGAVLVDGNRRQQTPG